jgi:hypothetical protein
MTQIMLLLHMQIRRYFNKISLLFHPIFLNLTCAYSYLYNLMLTASCMCRPSIYYYYSNVLINFPLKTYMYLPSINFNFLSNSYLIM